MSSLMDKYGPDIIRVFVFAIRKAERNIYINVGTYNGSVLAIEYTGCARSRIILIWKSIDSVCVIVIVIHIKVS